MRKVFEEPVIVVEEIRISDVITNGDPGIWTPDSSLDW